MLNTHYKTFQTVSIQLEGHTFLFFKCLNYIEQVHKVKSLTHEDILLKLSGHESELGFYVQIKDHNFVIFPTDILPLWHGEDRFL